MCGIAGIINFNDMPVAEQALQRMGSFLLQRGPDADGYWVKDHVGFTHRRLSIIDLSEKAAQPMHDVSNRVTITYNGEIYNYQEIHRELTALGFKFQTRSDTEVILNAYIQWGVEKLMEKLDGMFAFVLYDNLANVAYACRDRFGKKPLYYLNNSSRFCFSSDIRSIQAVERNLTIDYESLDYYLTELSVPQPKTIWNEIKQVRPAHFIQIDINKASITESCYWKLDFTKKSNLSLEETKQFLEEKLKESILKRLVGDVPIACFLSGGTDSGLITAILASNSSRQINTFSVGVNNEEMNELPFAKNLAKRYNTNHKEIIIEPDILHLSPELIEKFGEPFADSSCIPSYYICREMRREYKVALSGDGGDELFGGYYDYRWAFLTDHYLQQYPNKIFRTLLRPVNYIRSKTDTKCPNWGLLEHYNNLSGGLKLYREMGFHPNEKLTLYSKSFKENRKEFTLNYLNQQWNEANGRSLTDTLFEASLKTRLLNDYLVKSDRSSMMNSLEVRSPFLDYKLAEFAAAIPNHYKFKDGIQKYLLKELALKYIDRGFLSRKKMGFGIPLQNWLKNELKEYSREIIFSGSLKRRHLFDMSYIQKIVNEHQSGKHEHTHRIWALICLELWFNKFHAQ